MKKPRILLSLALLDDGKAIRCKVIKGLRIGSVIYTQGDVIEISKREYFVLRKQYPDYFEVIS